MNPFELLLRDAATGAWLRFSDPLRVLVARNRDEVPAMLHAVDEALAQGWWVAGMVAYEAAPAFDPALAVRPDSGFPCLAFGVFGPPVAASAPAPPAPSATSASGALRGTVTRAEFAAAMTVIREAIRQGDTYQVNFTYRLRGRLASDPWDLFRKLVAGHSATYAAWARVGPWTIASASPELFFRRDDDRITSRPMKGTAARGRTGEADLEAARSLLASRKERAENLMIVDMVRNDLSVVSSPGTVKVPDLFTLEAYPNVWQLTSLVESRSSAPLSALFGALFPAASITGAPKSSTTRIIARLESTPRRIYTGTLGFASPDGTAQFNVAIRTALVDTRTGRLEYGIGGGIVWDSDPEREYVESRTKAGILRRRPPDFELLETLRWNPGAGWALLDAHLHRMAASAAALGFAWDEAVVRGRLESAQRSFDEVMRVRLTLDRAGVPRVAFAPLESSAAFDRPRLEVAPACLSSADPFLVHKTTHREPYDRMRALCPDADDVLLWNERGEITETTWSNVFVPSPDGTLWTPPTSSGLLAGTFRASLLAEGRAREHVLTAEDVLTASRVLLGNSVRGLYEAGAVTDGRAARGRTV